ncbi:hypothetical protein VDG01_17510 [Xanthomonas campestris pv. raphani]|uniref:hypothetical protein n=2 Tax=Xanthomonas campestris TaxID=339 RepID=UPI002868435B|nr:hypothetical protein [Xanthomonas campestris]MEA9861877.1 hypothetical protein [Xanthomonas campestris pv. raphani]
MRTTRIKLSAHANTLLCAHVSPQRIITMKQPAVVFRLTLDQTDLLDRLLRTIAAYGDVIAVTAPDCLDAQTFPTIGQAIYDAANTARNILEQQPEQKQ